MKKKPQLTISVDSLFKFVAPKPDAEALIERLLDDDEFIVEVGDLTTNILKARLQHIDVKELRKAVDSIDDSSQIELAAFKAGFLFGVGYGKHQVASDD